MPLPATQGSIVTFLILITLLTITPGTDTALVLKSALKGGRRFYVATSLGICTGLLFHASMSSLGLSAILQQSAQLYSVIKLIGAAYLIYLGVRGLYETWLATARPDLAEKLEDASTVQPLNRQLSALRSASNPANSAAALTNSAANPLRQEFRTGLITNMLNPKVAVFYLTFLPQFVNTQKNVFVQTTALAFAHIVLSLVWLFTIGEFVTYFKTQLAKPATRKTIETVTSLAFLGFGLRLALSQAP